MITKENFLTNEYPVIRMSDNMWVIAPHELLRPFIANYTFTTPRTMPEQQAVLPTVSTTLVCSAGSDGMINGLRGVNTKPITIGGFARQFDFMFLIEFHSAGLYPFIKIDQNSLVDRSFSLGEVSMSLNRQIAEAYCQSNHIGMLKNSLDRIFLSRLDNSAINSTFEYAIKKVLANKGVIRIRELADDVYYSEKQLNRLFQKYVGTGIKTFSRIVRMKHAVDLLDGPIGISSLIEITGHYDNSHFIHDFVDIYGITPKEYIDRKSLFYNDPFKL